MRQILRNIDSVIDPTCRYDGLILQTRAERCCQSESLIAAELPSSAESVLLRATQRLLYPGGGYHVLSLIRCDDARRR
jgi:hypothetical protein